MSPYHCEYIWTLREPSTQVLSVYLRLSAKTKSLPLKTNFILVNQHFETISVLPTRRIFKNRGPSRRYQVAQNHKAQEKLGSSSTKAQRHEAGHRLNTASQDAQKPLSSATKSSTHEVRSSKHGSSFLKRINGSTHEVRSLCGE